jgi:hypothetical protein
MLRIVDSTKIKPEDLDQILTVINAPPESIEVGMYGYYNYDSLYQQAKSGFEHTKFDNVLNGIVLTVKNPSIDSLKELYAATCTKQFFDCPKDIQNYILLHKATWSFESDGMYRYMHHNQIILTPEKIILKSPDQELPEMFKKVVEKIPRYFCYSVELTR